MKEDNPLDLKTEGKDVVPTPSNIEFSNKIKTLRIVLIALSLFVFLGVALLVFLTVKKPGTVGESPSPFSSKQDIKIKKFTSDEEFRSYIAKTADVNNYGLGLDTLTVPTFQALEDRSSAELGAPSGGNFGKVVNPNLESQPDRYSGTNVQVRGIDEPDIVKTNGQQIFASTENNYYARPVGPIVFDEQTGNSRTYPQYRGPTTGVVQAFPVDKLSLLASIKESGNLLLSGNILMVFSNNNITAYDVSNASSPVKKWSTQMSGNNTIITSRLFDNKLYLVTATYMNRYSPCPIKIMEGDISLEIVCKEVYYPDVVADINSTYTVMQIDPESGEVNKKTSFLGSNQSSVVYMSPNAVYITFSIPTSYIDVFIDFYTGAGKDIIPDYVTQRLTKIKGYDISLQAKLVEFQKVVDEYRMSLSEDDQLKIENETKDKLEDYIKTRSRDLTSSGIVKIDADNLQISSSGKVPGTPLNQFSMDEYEGNLRIAVNVGGGNLGGMSSIVNDVYVLNGKLDMIGKVYDLGKTERIYSVRFIEDKGYVVTFRQVDPFYVIDLSNPQNPLLSGELKIPGYSSYLHPINKDKILGVGMEGSNVKISLFNVVNPASPFEADKYNLNEYWSEVNQTHHAFMIDKDKKIFFLPGGKGGYIFSYDGDELALVKAVSTISARRALYINNFLYVVGNSEIVVLDQNNWSEVKRISL